MRQWLCRAWLPALFALLLNGTPGSAGMFDHGIGSAMYYGPYTGGHIYSPNVAYGYGLSPRFADSWRYDPLAYPHAPYPYRPPYPLLQYFHPAPADATPGVIIEEPQPAALALQPVPANGRAAVVQVSVPPQAEVWFERQQTQQTGGDRIFYSPPLDAGKTYVYTVRARWTEQGREVEQFQAVSVQAGSVAAVRFPTHRP
jgi:uncharacterized protein (TIGR03000 family)